MSEQSPIQSYPAAADFIRTAHVDASSYASRYAASVSDPAGFWGREGRRVIPRLQK